MAGLGYQYTFNVPAVASFGAAPPPPATAIAAIASYHHLVGGMRKHDLVREAADTEPEFEQRPTP